MAGSSARWYVARLGAMSAPEIAWRLFSQLQRTVRPTPTAATRPSWDAEGWREALVALAASAERGLVADAERIAAGELDLWGRTVRTGGRPPSWDEHPFTGTKLPSTASRWSFDAKPAWELHRQQHLVPLAAGAARAGRADWAEAWAAHVLDWIERNPPGAGIGWTSGYEAAHRLVSWGWSAPFLTGLAPGEALERVAESFAVHAEFVRARPSRFSSANNHRLAELTGLLTAARLGVSREPWEDLWAELEHEVGRQTFADGGSREQAAGYFLYVLEILWVAGVLARSAGRELGRIAERLESMLAWLQAVAGPDGEPPQVGDDAEDRLVRLSYFEPRKATVLAGRVRSLLSGSPVPAAEIAGEPPGPALLPESGYAVFRGPRALRGVLDVGELGFGSLAAHGHADALSFLLDVDGVSLLRDSGTGSYALAEGRDRYRLTDAHSTVLVDGESQARPLGPHLWGRRYRTTLEGASLQGERPYVRASHDGYRRARAKATHTRTVAHVQPELLIVLDRVRAERPCTATLAWQLAPGATPPQLAVDVGMSVVSEPSGEFRLAAAPFSPRYGRHDEAPRASWSATGAEVVFATAIVVGTGVPPAVEITHRASTTTVEVRGPVAATIVERWSGAPEVRT